MEDHPRLCGNNLKELYSVNVREGSPPPVREQRMRMRLKSATVMDHPRLCGNNYRQGFDLIP